MIDPAVIYDAGKAVLTFVGGLLSLWITQKAVRRNARAVEKTSELDVKLRPMQEINDAWEKLNKPLIEELNRLSKARNTDSDKIKSLEDALHSVETEQGVLMREFRRALHQLVSYAHWIDKGALPPPPDIPPWLREHMVGAISDLMDKHGDNRPEGP